MGYVTMKLEEVIEEFNEVDKPAHYHLAIDGKQIETIKIIEATLSPEEFIGFCKGNIIKYTLRSKGKGKEQDWKKADWYSAKLREKLR